METGLATSWPLLRVVASVPTAISYGASDIVGPAVIADLAKGLGAGKGEGKVRVREFARSGHLAHVTEREEYVEWLMAGLDDVDARRKKTTKTGSKAFSAGKE